MQSTCVSRAEWGGGNLRPPFGSLCVSATEEAEGPLLFQHKEPQGWSSATDPLPAATFLPSSPSSRLIPCHSMPLAAIRCQPTTNRCCSSDRDSLKRSYTSSPFLLLKQCSPSLPSPRSTYFFQDIFPSAICKFGFSCVILQNNRLYGDLVSLHLVYILYALSIVLVSLHSQTHFHNTVSVLKTGCRSTHRQSAEGEKYWLACLYFAQPIRIVLGSAKHKIQQRCPSNKEIYDWVIWLIQNIAICSALLQNFTTLSCCFLMFGNHVRKMLAILKALTRYHPSE